MVLRMSTRDSVPLNDRQIFDGMHSEASNKKLVSRRKLDLPLDSFETKAVGFCKRAVDVVVV